MSEYNPGYPGYPGYPSGGNFGNFGGYGDGDWSTGDTIGLIASLLAGFAGYQSADAQRDAARDYYANPTFAIPPDIAGLRQLLGPLLGTGLVSGAPMNANPLTQMVYSRLGESMSPDFWRDYTESPDKFLNRWGDATRDSWLDDLNATQDATQARLGGEFGIRFGTDVTRSLGTDAQKAMRDRDASYANMIPELARIQLTGRQMASQLPLQVGEFDRANRLDPYQLAMSFATSYPGVMPYIAQLGLSPSAAGLGTFSELLYGSRG